MITQYYNGTDLRTIAELHTQLGSTDPAVWKSLGGYLPVVSVEIPPEFDGYYDFQLIPFGDDSYIRFPMLNGSILALLQNCVKYIDLIRYNDSNYLNDPDNDVKLKGIHGKGLSILMNTTFYDRKTLEINGSNELVIDGVVVPTGTTINVKSGDTLAYLHDDALDVTFNSVSRSGSMDPDEVNQSTGLTGYTFKTTDNVVQLIVDSAVRLEFQRQDFTVAETT